jgi:NAD(P)-dependent dehydrogenase (short-subunit alcohol dehydrogenase family)
VVAIEANLLGWIFMIRAMLPGMRARKFGRIIKDGEVLDVPLFGKRA